MSSAETMHARPPDATNVVAPSSPILRSPPLCVQALWDRVVWPEEWSQGPPKDHPCQLDTRLQERLERARDELQNVSFNEDIRKAHDKLLRLGLVPLLSSEGPSPSQQVQLGQWVVHLIDQGGVRLIVDPENSRSLDIPRTDLLIWIAAVFFNIDIIVISSARHPQVYHALSPPNMTIGLFWVKDSFGGVSTISVLTCTKTTPRPAPAVKNIAQPPQSTPAATFREDARECKRSTLDHSKDKEALICACLLKVKELSQKSISALISKRLWKIPKDKTREELQREAYEEILKRELSKKTLPNGIVDRAAKIIYGVSAAITCSMKMCIQPHRSEERLQVWHDILRSMLYTIWTAEWGLGRDGASAFAHPDPNEPKEDYRNLWGQLQGNDPGNDSGPSPDSQIVDIQTLNDISTLADEPEEDESQLRICTAKFNRIIREEHVTTKNDGLILEEVQRVQREMAPVVSDAFTVAHMTAIIVAAGGAYRNDDERPSMYQFQLSSLVPKPFQRQGFQSTLNVAAITKGIQNSIEENASLPRTLQDERFRILSSHYIKKTLTHVRSDTTSTSVPCKVDSTPLWTAIAEQVATAGYSFQPTPRGLSHTAALHVSQAAVSVNNHWSQAHYKKSFKYTALNALRLLLAPSRFRRYEQRRVEEAIKKENRDLARSDSAQGTISRSRWTEMVKDRCNELARVVRKYSSEEMAAPRIAAIIASLASLQQVEPPRSSKPPIATIHARQQEAIANAQATAPSVELEDEIEDDDEDPQPGVDPEEEEQEADEIHDARPPSQDNDEDHELDDETEFTQPTRDSSARQINSLFVVVNTLTHSPYIERDVTKGYVRKNLLRKMEATDRELAAVKQIVNALRPFTPKRVPTEKGHRDPTPHVVLFAPMVLIAEAFLSAVGLHRFQRRFSPRLAVGSTPALLLSPAVVYEVLANSSSNKFDVVGPSGGLITSASNASMPRNHESVLSGFFSMDLIKQLCRDHNIEFGNKLIFVDKNRIRLSGKLLPSGWPRCGQQLTSQYEQRVLTYNKGSKVSHVWASERIHWESMGTSHADVEQAVDQLTKNAKDSANRLKLIKKDYGPDSQQAFSAKQELFQLRREQYYWQKIEKVMRDKAGGKPDAKAPTPIKVLWHAHQAEEEPARLDITPIVHEVMQYPSKLLAFGGGDPGVRVTLEGQQQTLAEVESHLIRYRTLYGNPYSVLSEMEGDVPSNKLAIDMDSNMDLEGTNANSKANSMALDTKKHDLSQIRLPRPHRVKARNLQMVSFTKKLQGERLRRLNKRAKGKRKLEANLSDNDDSGSSDVVFKETKASDAEQAHWHMKEISRPENSLTGAITLEDVAHAARVRQKAHGPLQHMEASPALIRMRKTQELRKARALAKTASNLKKSITDHALANVAESTSNSTVDPRTGFCSGCRRYHQPAVHTLRHGLGLSTNQHLAYPATCPKAKPETVTIMAYGTAGSGVGARIGGHLKWGGKWLRHQLLRLDTIVALTDEYNTSQVCVHCYNKLQLARSSRLRGTEIRSVRVHGSVVCTNPSCVAVQCGYATRPRDSNAAIGILISYASIAMRNLVFGDSTQWMPPWPIPPYSRYARPKSLPRKPTDPCDSFQDTRPLSLEQTSAIAAHVGEHETR